MFGHRASVAGSSACIIYLSISKTITEHPPFYSPAFRIEAMPTLQKRKKKNRGDAKKENRSRGKQKKE